jgi:sugar phosphate isomerase/epimerase
VSELSRLSLNQASIPAWNVAQAAEGCARAGVGWIGLWRDRVAETGLETAARQVADAGIRVSSLCRGGWFSTGDPDRRRDDNRRAVEEAARLGAPVLVLVCGPGPGGDLEEGRRRVADGIADLAPLAETSGVRLAVEPLHPMYCADRSVVVTLDQALRLAVDAGHGTGVIVDAYHVWWDPAVWAGIAAAGERILGFHVNDWLDPTPDILNGRGLMGDGVIDLRRLRGAVDEAGYEGPIEVEIFSDEFARRPPDQALARICERYLEHVAAPGGVRR